MTSVLLSIVPFKQSEKKYKRVGFYIFDYRFPYTDADSFYVVPSKYFKPYTSKKKLLEFTESIYRILNSRSSLGIYNRPCKEIPRSLNTVDFGVDVKYVRN